MAAGEREIFHDARFLSNRPRPDWETNRSKQTGRADLIRRLVYDPEQRKVSAQAHGGSGPALAEPPGDWCGSISYCAGFAAGAVLAAGAIGFGFQKSGSAFTHSSSG